VPDYLRLRSLAVSERTPLAHDVAVGLFEKAGDVDMVQEILQFLEHVGDIQCELVSDHALNLIQDLDGNLMTSRQTMISKARLFLALEPELQRTYMVGRRLGLLRGLDDLKVPSVLTRVRTECRRLEVTERNVDVLINELAKQFL
jgi:hypothetical protein